MFGMAHLRGVLLSSCPQRATRTVSKLSVRVPGYSRYSVRTVNNVDSTSHSTNPSLSSRAATERLSRRFRTCFQKHRLANVSHRPTTAHGGQKVIIEVALLRVPLLICNNAGEYIDSFLVAA